MKRPNLYDYLKIIAIVTMIVDHIGFLFFPDQVIWRIIGRTAFPLFLFLVGYNHSYQCRSSLWIYGIILQLIMRVGSMYGFIDMWYANILLAIGCTRIVMNLFQKYDSPFGGGILFIVCGGLVRYVQDYVDYGTLSIMFALLGYWVRKYGNTIYVSILIASSVCYHLFFMMYVGSLKHHLSSLIIVGIVLFAAMYIMSKDNYTLQTSIYGFDKSISRLSNHALEIYMIQIILLGSVYLISS